MAILKFVYTEQDKSVQLYRDCDIESICRSWLDKFVECKDISVVFVFTFAQELVLKTMQMLLIRDYKQLTTEDVLFYIEENQCVMDSDWHFDPYPENYPDYQGKCLEIMWDL